MGSCCAKAKEKEIEIVPKAEPCMEKRVMHIDVPEVPEAPVALQAPAPDLHLHALRGSSEASAASSSRAPSQAKIEPSRPARPAHLPSSGKPSTTATWFHVGAACADSHVSHVSSVVRRFCSEYRHVGRYGCVDTITIEHDDDYIACLTYDNYAPCRFRFDWQGTSVQLKPTNLRVARAFRSFLHQKPVPVVFTFDVATRHKKEIVNWRHEVAACLRIDDAIGLARLSEHALVHTFQMEHWPRLELWLKSESPSRHRCAVSIVANLMSSYRPTAPNSVWHALASLRSTDEHVLRELKRALSFR